MFIILNTLFQEVYFHILFSHNIRSVLGLSFHQSALNYCCIVINPIYGQVGAFKPAVEYSEVCTYHIVYMVTIQGYSFYMMIGYGIRLFLVIG